MMTIGEIAHKSGLAVSAIRYYEACGVLPAAHRQANNRRCYDQETLEALEFIAACRKNGMGLEAIRQLKYKLTGPADICNEASMILTDAVKELSAKIAELQAARRHLSKVASACSADRCGQGGVSCNIGSNMKTRKLA